MAEYLTTKELAELLRIKERKVYDLAASGKVPCSKATGKLLFPRKQIEAWIQSGQQSAGAPGAASVPLPNVVVGSHDPLLDWALRESGSGLAAYSDGSTDGLRRMSAREGLAAGLHLYDASSDDWNTPRMLGDCTRLPVVLIEWARRLRGLIVAGQKASTGAIKSLGDLAGRRFSARQDDAGAQILFVHLAGQAGLAVADLDVTVRARNESDAALAVLEGKADACFGLRSLAEQYKLDFVPLIEERFDLLVDRRSYFEPPLQTLLRFCGTPAFRKRASEFAGYDVRGLGRVHFNSPT